LFAGELNLNHLQIKPIDVVIHDRFFGGAQAKPQTVRNQSYPALVRVKACHAECVLLS
jgi:hypothetical protein